MTSKPPCGGGLASHIKQVFVLAYTCPCSSQQSASDDAMGRRRDLEPGAFACARAPSPRHSSVVARGPVPTVGSDGF